jgi:hypothetical protein
MVHLRFDDVLFLYFFEVGSFGELEGFVMGFYADICEAERKKQRMMKSMKLFDHLFRVIENDYN